MERAGSKACYPAHGTLLPVYYTEENGDAVLEGCPEGFLYHVEFEAMGRTHRIIGVEPGEEWF